MLAFEFLLVKHSRVKRYTRNMWAMSMKMSVWCSSTVPSVQKKNPENSHTHKKNRTKSVKQKTFLSEDSKTSRKDYRNRMTTQTLGNISHICDLSACQSLLHNVCVVTVCSTESTYPVLCLFWTPSSLIFWRILFFAQDQNEIFYGQSIIREREKTFLSFSVYKFQQFLRRD